MRFEALDANPAEEMALRWGIVSAGKISHDFVGALKSLSHEDHKVVAVAARSLSNAEDFAKNHNIPKAYEGYLKIAEDDDVDIVYVGTLNHQHFPVSKMMLEHGKHVLCEKPLTMNQKQTSELIGIAIQKKLFLMEGIWSRCFPIYTELKYILDAGSIGDVIQINVNFGFDLQDVDRLKSKKLGGGTILDLGIYALQLTQLVFKGASPLNMAVIGGLNEDGVDEYTSSIWKYPGDRIACLSTSGKAEYPNEAVIIGTRGIIRIPEFWCPTKMLAPEKTYEFKLPTTSAKFNFHNSVGLLFEAEHARKCVKSGMIESPLITHAESIQLASYMDALRASVGVVFEEDKQ